LITVTAIKDCFAKYGFPVDHVCSNDENALKLAEDRKMTYSLQPLGVQFEDYPTRDSALEVCGVQNIDQMFGPAVGQARRRIRRGGE
jgi:hypothetical protein